MMTTKRGLAIRFDELPESRREFVLATVAGASDAEILRGVARALGFTLPNVARHVAAPFWRVERTLNGRSGADPILLAKIQAVLGVSDCDLRMAKQRAVEGPR